MRQIPLCCNIFAKKGHQPRPRVIVRRKTGGERATLAPPVSASPVGKLRRRDAKA